LGWFLQPDPGQARRDERKDRVYDGDVRDAGELKRRNEAHHAQRRKACDDPPGCPDRDQLDEAAPTLGQRLLPFDAWTILFWRGVFGGGGIVAFLVLRRGGGSHEDESQAML